MSREDQANLGEACSWRGTAFNLHRMELRRDSKLRMKAEGRFTQILYLSNGCIDRQVLVTLLKRFDLYSELHDMRDH